MTPSRHPDESRDPSASLRAEQKGDPDFRRDDGVAATALIALARFWQLYPSVILPPSCRYAPSCSAYAIEALTRYGAGKGSWLAARRLCRCHPWGGSGYDPVP